MTAFYPEGSKDWGVVFDYVIEGKPGRLTFVRLSDGDNDYTFLAAVDQKHADLLNAGAVPIIAKTGAA